ncbi:glycosyltransferase [Oceanimonas marisflavi]|uniref:glycosyltransferase n=1 Tax=Oceanimonas marisflavi TaxID=2059724 RepID=UPI0018E51B78|nr:glycosyltransferase [Oceanimonas marisflavi]
MDNKILSRISEHFSKGEYSACIAAYDLAKNIYPQWADRFQTIQNILKNSYPIFHFKKSYDAEITKVPDIPSNFPAWLKLPPIKGVGNDYTFIEEAREHWIKANRKSYTMGASIVIPVYNRSIEVDFVLAGLVHQTYPRHLMEVIISDDGSQEDISKVYKKYDQYFTIKHCRQEDLGYRLAEARNMGVRAASHDNIIILDSDAIPNEELVEKYMQFFHVSRNIAMFGLRHYVTLSHLNPEDYRNDKNVIHKAEKIRSENTVAAKVGSDGYSADWREEQIAKSNDAKDDKLPYRFLVGANCAFSREVFDRVGGYCEEFRAWGFEDQEFGYRLLREGTYFIPVKHNYVYHQEPLAGKNDTDRQLGSAITKPIYIEKCPFIYRKNEAKKSEFEAPLVSIYVPLYNREKFIVESIQSALEQSIRDLEVVVCDDGSTDRSNELVRKYFRKNKRVRLLSQKNSGIASASNTAVNNCRGFYIGQLDADDVLMTDAVERCLEVIDKDTKLSLVYGTTEYIDENSNFLSKGWNWPVFSREYLLTKMIVHHFRFFRKRDFMRTAGFDESIRNAVDYDMMLKLSEVGKVKHLNRVLYQYRRHTEMTTVLHGAEQSVNHYKAINNSLCRLGLNDIVARPNLKFKDSKVVEFLEKKYLNGSI